MKIKLVLDDWQRNGESLANTTDNDTICVVEKKNRGDKQ